MARKANKAKPQKKAIPPELRVVCAVTGKEGQSPGPNRQGALEPPRGWKRFGGAYYTAEGAMKAFCLRSHTAHVCAVELLPLHRGDYPPEILRRSQAAWASERMSRDGLEPLAGEHARGHDFGLLRDALCVCWRQCAQAANWMTSWLASLDVLPLEGGDLPAQRLTYDRKVIDHRLREMCPDVDSQSLYQVIKAAERKYLKERFHVRVLGAKSLPSFRNPMPLPVPGKDVAFVLLDGDRVALDLRLAGLWPCMRFRLHLAADPKSFGAVMEHYRAAARAAEVGAPIHGALTVRKNRRGRILAGLPVYSARPAADGPRPEAVLYVFTAAHNLVTGAMRGRDGPRAFTINRLDLKRRIERHRDYLDRASQDRKAERQGRVRGDDRRQARQSKRNFQRSVEARCAAHRDYLADQIHKVAAEVAGHAERRKITQVIYDDADRGWMPDGFRYADLARLVGEKLDARGVGFTLVAEGRNDEQ